MTGLEWAFGGFSLSPVCATLLIQNIISRQAESCKTREHHPSDKFLNMLDICLDHEYQVYV